tara:strand:- start:7264 stop:8862 length:1599 start_codon:yes stop_codon:yes gene_type:complete
LKKNKQKGKAIKVIDLFAGPGGLSEGFAGYGKNKFKIALSIEKEKSAHRTLLLRSFFRQFPNGAPDEYYQFLQGKLGKTPEEKLYSSPKFKKQIDAARRETQCLELGVDNPKKIYGKIKDALNGDECVLIGGPPCQAYSIASKSRKPKSKQSAAYRRETKTRQNLYKEYLKIVAKFQPVVFVMENVKGLLSVKLNGEMMIDLIVNDLKNPVAATGVRPEGEKKRHNYEIFSFVTVHQGNLFEDSVIQPSDYVIRSEEYGVPQTRHRVILFGIRKDYCHKKINQLKKQDKCPTTKDVLSDLPQLRSYISHSKSTDKQWDKIISRFRKEYLPVIKKEYRSEKKMLDEFEKSMSAISGCKFSAGDDLGMKKRKKISNTLSSVLKKWYHDERMENYIVNHTVRGHMLEDFCRYLFSAVYTKIHGRSPRLNQFPRRLLPKHKNRDLGHYVDRFRVQDSKKPATTITSHISKDGHYYIHYDPTQCRSLTVREAARIQTFPDNYFFAGNRTEQYIQTGNAVPPFLARQLAEIVFLIVGK